MIHARQVLVDDDDDDDDGNGEEDDGDDDNGNGDEDDAAIAASCVDGSWIAASDTSVDDDDDDDEEDEEDEEDVDIAASAPRINCASHTCGCRSANWAETQVAEIAGSSAAASVVPATIASTQTR